MSRRRGVSLVEVLIGALILATSLSVIFGLIEWTRRMAQEAATRDLARTVAADLLARLGSSGFRDLSARFGTARDRKDPMDDPVIRRMITPMAKEIASRGLEARADFRRAGSGMGYLQVAVTYPVGPEKRDAITLSRLLPNPALQGSSVDSGPDSLMARASRPLGANARRPGPATAEADRLYFSLVSRMPTSAVARFLDFAMATDRMDAKYDVDWPRLVDPRLEESAQWARLLEGLTSETIPDGVYAATTRAYPDPLAATGFGGRPARLTLHVLEDSAGTEHFLLRVDHADDLVPPVHAGAKPARDLGAFDVRRLLALDPPAAPRRASQARVLATERRTFVFMDRYDETGKPLPFQERIGVFTAPGAIDPFAVYAPLTVFLPRAFRQAGLETAPRRLEALPAAF